LKPDTAVTLPSSKLRASHGGCYLTHAASGPYTKSLLKEYLRDAQLDSTLRHSSHNYRQVWLRRERCNIMSVATVILGPMHCCLAYILRLTTKPHSTQLLHRLFSHNKYQLNSNNYSTGSKFTSTSAEYTLQHYATTPSGDLLVRDSTTTWTPSVPHRPRRPPWPCCRLKTPL
jgi:hypothetical protein